MATKRRQSSRTTASAVAEPGQSTPRSTHHTRPGVETATRLLSREQLCVGNWERALSYYGAMLKAKGGTTLVKLDKQREDIAKGWRPQSSDDGDDTAGMTMTKEQLLNVMIAWKFTKGKPRHALKPLLDSNSDASVTTAAEQAFAAADGIPKNGAGGTHAKQMSSAMNRLCELRGVGPATASCILCLYRPDIFAFMDDEVIECLHDGKRGYTLKIYTKVNDRCRDIATQLNQADSASEWTPCEVGQALWSLATMGATNDGDGISAVFEDGKETSSSSRKRTKKG